MKIHITFPYPVKQESANSVSVEAKPILTPILSDVALDQIATFLSNDERDRLGDDIADFAQREAIRRSLRVSSRVTQ